MFAYSELHGWRKPAGNDGVLALSHGAAVGPKRQGLGGKRRCPSLSTRDPLTQQVIDRPGGGGELCLQLCPAGIERTHVAGIGELGLDEIHQLGEQSAVNSNGVHYLNIVRVLAQCMGKVEALMENTEE